MIDENLQTYIHISIQYVSNSIQSFHEYVRSNSQKDLQDGPGEEQGGDGGESRTGGGKKFGESEALSKQQVGRCV